MILQLTSDGPFTIVTDKQKEAAIQRPLEPDGTRLDDKYAVTIVGNNGKWKVDIEQGIGPEEEYPAYFDALIEQASEATTLAQRVLIAENLLLFLVSRLPEAEQSIAKEILHTCGIETDQGDGEPGDIDDRSDYNPYTGQAEIENTATFEQEYVETDIEPYD